MARWRTTAYTAQQSQAWRAEYWSRRALAFLVALWVPASATVPQFFEADKMAALRLAADTAVGGLIYRLDADRDYPLTFSIGGVDRHMLSVKSGRDEFGYVYLRQRLNERKNYSFVITVSDTDGDTTEVISRIIPTSGRTPLSDIFLDFSSSATVEENSPVDTNIVSVVVRRRPAFTVDFEIVVDER
ncbi:uncharacterized protein LOC122267088 [Penaeus japonicus]|uniref:uncharacterized protein LOC122267088 n=1 Tax=Penaeus japonicus TaxID=27405 RepID=UPI001C71198C|nr:uncharacterized protein LOC122267088 [Penaeus japonicus]